MARKVNVQQVPQNLGQPFDSGPMTPSGGSVGIEIPEAAQLKDPTLPVASVVREPDPNAPPLKWFRVVRGGRILWGGAIVDIKTGKEFDESVYDLSFLRQRGIICEGIPAPY